MSWWRRKLDPLPQETLQRDQKIIELDRELAEEHGAARERQQRLNRFLAQMGELFVGSVLNMEHDIGGEG